MSRVRHRICQGCGVGYIAANGMQMYCAPACKKSAKHERMTVRIPHTCLGCGAEYTISKVTLKNPRHKSKCPDCVRKARVDGFKSNPPPRGGSHRKAYQSRDTRVKVNAPCKTCAYGERNAASDIGWACKANAFFCSPLSAKRLYQKSMQAT
jgi:hypothetical protein